MSDAAKQRILGAMQHLQTAIELLMKAEEVEPDAGYRADIKDERTDIAKAYVSLHSLVPQFTQRPPASS